ncbi:30S ribosomal protein S3 [candidate division KSB1 bacterium]|nr:30S ribosomal protein S3 [candidate division KSB1 bacterium]
MGQKVNPISFRIGITRTWLSQWYAKKDYAKLLHEDLEIRKFLKKKLYHAGVSKIEIERAAQKISINVFSARPGIIIGKRGYEIDRLKADLQKRVNNKQLSLNIKEVRKTEIDAQLVAENIALQLERRVAFRRVMKKSITTALRFGAKGIRINCAGRLGGAEIARTEWYRQGRVPLHTLRADIDYGFAESRTTYGIIGVKVWIFTGEVIGTNN